MTDNDLRIHLADLAADARPIDLYGASVARSRQIRQRRLIAATATLAGVVAVIAGATAVLLPRPTAAPLPPIAPTESATVSPSPSPTATTPPARPDPLPIAANYTGPLEVPKWPAPAQGQTGCPDGPLTFVNGVAAGPGVASTVLRYVTSGDLGGNPAWVVEFQCQTTSTLELAAYHVADGEYALLGKLTDMPTSSGQIGIGIDSIAVAADQIVVTVRVQTLASWARPTPAGTITQVRKYVLRNSAIVQTAGPSGITFNPNVAALTVTLGHLIYEPAQNGCRKGTFTYTLSNAGPKTAVDISAVLFVHLSPGTDCPATPGGSADAYVAAPIALSANESRTFTVTVYESEKVTGPIPPQIVYPNGYNYMQLHVAGMLYPSQTPLTIELL